jgi:autotransporter-associated beta strand protein
MINFKGASCLALKTLIASAVVGAAGLGRTAIASSNTWTGADAGSFGNWADPNNWTGGVPTTGQDLYFGQYNAGTQNGVNIASLDVNSINCTPSAAAFSTDVGGGDTLTIDTGGIFNTSGNTQTIIVDAWYASPTTTLIFSNGANAGDVDIYVQGAYAILSPNYVSYDVPAMLEFTGNSTAAGTTIINQAAGNTGGSSTPSAGASVEFSGTSTAGFSTITNQGGAYGASLGAALTFTDSSTAGHANIDNQGGQGTLPNYGTVNGLTTFESTSSAGHSTISNDAGLTGSFGGTLIFQDSATAANATITNHAPVAVSGGFDAGQTVFYANTTGGSATIINEGSGIITEPGGSTTFQYNTDGGSTTITNDGATLNGAAGGSTRFEFSATGDMAAITNSPGTLAGAFGGTTYFVGGATGATATITNNAGAVSGAYGGTTYFEDKATGATTTITNYAGAVSGAHGGVTEFLGATAGSATITNYGSSFAAVTGVYASLTLFDGGGSGGTATISNKGGLANGAPGGQTQFGLTANSQPTASSAVITNYGGAVNGALGGSVLFQDKSSGGNATINNDPGTLVGAMGGATSFTTNAVAGAATILNAGATVAGAGAGSTTFTDSAAGGTATITNAPGAVNGAAGGVTTFNSTSAAGAATLNNNAATVAGATAGLTVFNDNASAGSANINNAGATVTTLLATGAGQTHFNDSTLAGTATITNNGATSSVGDSAQTDFFGSSSADHSSIINNPGAFISSQQGFTSFAFTSTLGNATITNNAATNANAGPGTTIFNGESTAGAGTIINNDGAAGGITYFLGNSDGGTARAITYGSGQFDISGLATAGMNIGSIEGSGNYFLGGKILTVGGNNLSTVVSGPIQDLGHFGGNGGALTKTGSGKLSLTGINTYTGATTISQGILSVDGSITASSGVTIQSGGALGGSGTVPAITLQSGGTIAPGDSPGTLHGASLIWNGGGAMSFELATPSNSDQIALTGALSMGTSGVFPFTFIDEGIQINQTYNLISFSSTSFLSAADFTYTNPSPFSGNFAIVNDVLEFTPTSVPEATSITLLLGAGALCAIRRRRPPNNVPPTWPQTAVRGIKARPPKSLAPGCFPVGSDELTPIAQKRN